MRYEYKVFHSEPLPHEWHRMGIEGFTLRSHTAYTVRKLFKTKAVELYVFQKELR